jgi:hypothetical protein
MHFCGSFSVHGGNYTPLAVVSRARKVSTLSTTAPSAANYTLIVVYTTLLVTGSQSKNVSCFAWIYGPIAIADWLIIVHCHLLVKLIPLLFSAALPPNNDYGINRSRGRRPFGLWVRIRLEPGIFFCYTFIGITYLHYCHIDSCRPNIVSTETRLM